MNWWEYARNWAECWPQSVDLPGINAQKALAHAVSKGAVEYTGAGKVLDVHYEDTVLDLEGQVRRILDYCGLPFEEQCLRYYETDRAVNTASSEQVRQPIYRDALGKWRRYEKHLGYWKEELADIIDELPESIRNAGL